MSDLDKAIRAELARDYWRLSRHSSTAADKGATAVLALLDWASGLEGDSVSGSNQIVRTLTRQVRVIIADSLCVSGENRSEPTPAPRECRADDPEPPVGTKLTGGGFTWTRHGRSWQTPEGGVLNWAQLTEFCPRLSEVVSPEGTP